MKRKSLLLLLLLALGAPWAAMGQQETITIGTGTSTQNASPMNNYWNYSLTEMIYSKTEIANQNPASNTITKVGFQLAANGLNGKTYTVAIYMKNIDYTSFSTATWESLSSSNQVYSGTVTSTSSGWVTITLDSPFTYDNTKSLLIGVNKTAGGYAGSSYYWNYTSTSNTHLEVHNDDNAYSITSMPSSPTRNGARPNVQLTFRQTNPYITVSPTSATIVTGATQPLTATYGNVTGTPSITYSSSNTGVATVSGSGTTATVTGVADGTATITATMTYNGTNYTATSTITVDNSVVIGTGTSKGYYTPLVGNYKSSYDQMIYTTSQLQTAGINAAGSITKIGFNSSASNSQARNVKIYMGNTSKTSFSSGTDFVAFDDLTLVYDYSASGNGQWNITAGWNEFELDTPFDYDGTSNLVIAVHCGLASSYASTSFYYTSTTNNQAVYAYNDNTDPVPATYDGNWSNYPSNGSGATSYKATTTSLPNLKIRVVVSSTPKPKNLAVSNITATDATLTWQAPSSATPTGYAYSYKKSTDASWPADTQTSNLTVSLSNLDPTTEYVFRVKANYAAGSSDYVETSFTTLSLTMAPTVTYEAVTAHTATVTWTGASANVHHQSFDLYYSTTNTAPGDNPSGDTYYPGLTTTSQQLTGLTHNMTYYAWVRDNCGTDGYSEWVQTSFTTVNATVAPTVTYEAVTAHTATVKWTGASANDHHASFDLYYSTTNTAPGNTPSGDTYFPGLTTTSQELTGLDPETTYYAWVRDNCGTDGYSSWASTSFTTDIACYAPTNLAVANITGHTAQLSWTGYSDSYEVQYREASSITYDFENGIQGWTTIDADGHGDAWSCYNDSGDSHGGSGFMEAIYNYDFAHQDYLVSPAIPLGGSVSFYAKKGGSYSDTFRVYLSTSGNTSASNFTIELTNGNVTPTTEYVQYTYNLSSYSGTGYVAIVYTAAANQGWLYVDDVTVTKGGAVDEWHTATVNEASYALEGLDPETIYEWQVRGNCGEEGYSAWSSTENFTTDVACPAPTNLTVSNVTVHTANPSWNGSSDSYNVRYGMVLESSTTFDFENQDIPSSWTNDATYPWVIASNGHGSSYSMKSGNSGNHSTTSSIEVPVELANDGTISFYCLASCESSSSYWDYGIFYIDGDQKDSFLHVTDWQYKTYQLTAGTHTLKWTFTKDSSGEGGDDCFYVDDITITSSSVEEWTTTTSSTNSATLTGLQPETTYQVQVQGDCGDDDGMSLWSNLVSFTTLSNCAVPTNLAATNLSATSADLSWTGVQESYNVRYGIMNTTGTVLSTNFESNVIPTAMTNSTTYPWTVTSSGANSSSYCAIPGNNGVNSSDSDLTFVVTGPGTVSFSAKVSSESGYDYGRFLIDGTQKVNISGTTDWTSYSFEFAAGTHTLIWRYHKDGSSASGNDLFYVDDITVEGLTVGEWVTNTNVTSPLEISGLEPTTTYEWQVQGVACSGTDNTDWSAISNFTTAAGYTVAVSVNNSLQGSATITYQGEEVESPAEITPNASVTVTATAAIGYAFDYWGEYNATTEEYDSIEGAEAEYTIEHVNVNYNLKAFFVESRHTLTIVTNPANAGTVTVTVNGETYTDSEVEIPEGATAALTIVAEEGYMVNVINVSGEGSSVNVVTTLPATNVTATFTMGSDDASMTVAFLVPATDIVFDAEDGYEGDESGHWFLFTSPLNGSVSPEEVDNLTSNPDDPEAGYDLYMFDQTGADNGNEWVNYKDSENGGGFDLVAGTGYLYASEFGATLTFHGVPYEGDGVITITNESENKWHGWNLVGNPYYYAEEAWSSLPYYSMNNGAELMSHTAAESLAPMEGFFVYSEDEESTVTVSTTAPNNGKSASLVLNVSRGRGLLDRAIVSFGDNNTLPKFQLNPSHTKVYIPREERDYAIVSAEDEMGEMPVSFKAEKSGSYTISVTAEGVSFGYLHLIDNMTGNDVDLLQTSSYTFNALDTDYASRFKLVFATGNATGDNFAFYSNGSWVISNEGEATLQVVDVTGRVLRSESVNGCTSVNMSAAPGVYMLRLINGDNVKVQKVVVRR